MYLIHNFGITKGKQKVNTYLNVCIERVLFQTKLTSPKLSPKTIRNKVDKMLVMAMFSHCVVL